MRRVVAVLGLALFAAACGSGNLQKPAAQDDFGVQMAKMNLWREAMFRFQRAVQIDPNDARAHNNLAVAYEATGDFENARKEYLEALKLDRTNAYIQKNYSRYVEFLSRNRKRQQKGDAKAAGPLMPKEGSTVVDTDRPVSPPSTGGTTPKPVSVPTPPSDLPPPTQPGPPAAPQPPPQPPPSTATPSTPPPTPPPGGFV